LTHDGRLEQCRHASGWWHEPESHPTRNESILKLLEIDAWLISRCASPHASKLQTFIYEFWIFGLKQIRACLFVGLFFFAVFMTPREGLFGLARYDLLLVWAIGIQAWMLFAKLETWDEVKAIGLFHLVGFALEVFKTSGSIQSWTYPDAGYTKVFGVPLFAGFMYAAVGSYIIQAWRLFDLKIRHHPIYWISTLIALLIYANFFTHHYVGDYRWYLAAAALGLYSRTMVIYSPASQERRMPLLVSFVLIGFFIWLAENFSTFFGLWKYPNQMGAWSLVHIGKWSSWSMLVIMTITIVVNLKHYKSTTHVPD
jgi:uncharacterized membrane protein YoaT (DUF817 family)